MTRQAHELATKISSVDPAEVRAACDTIDRLDETEPRFSNRALDLINQMGNDSIYARGPLRKEIGKSNKTGSWVEEKEEHSAEQLLRLAVMSYSSYTLERLTDGVYVTLILPTSIACDQRISSTHPELRPDIFEDNLDVINRYYKPMAAAAEILDYDLDKEENREAVAAFIAWAGKQENMDEALACAMKIKNIQSEHVSAFIALQKETTIPLHDGLL